VPRQKHPKELGCTIDRMEYLQTIVSIITKSTQQPVSYKTLEIQKISAKYSNTKKPIYKLIIDDKPISRNNDIIVTYKCKTCAVQQSITLNLFMRKVNNGGRNCIRCINYDEQKCQNHSAFMKNLPKTYRKPEKKVVSLSEYLENSLVEFEKEDDEFKSAYFLSHLTDNDYERIASKIKSVGNKKLINLSGWEYFPVYKIHNQTRYTPMLINKTSNSVEKPYYIEFQCENCEVFFVHRDLEVVKNHYKIFCKDCSFTNKIFKIRTMELQNGDKIRWQSVPEKRFIEWCEEKNIRITNGPTIEYEFHGTKKYKVDFELVDKKLLVEIKDNHCWHKSQVASGKFGAKEDAAKKWCDKNDYTFHVVFPKTMAAFKAEICKI
jgi:hypothetical protein